jgi:hypothetical protein
MEELIGILLSKLLDRKIREGRHDYIEEAREKAEELEYHFENEYPERLLNSQHPSEEPWMKDYRKKRWQAPTTTATGRVYTFLQKIQQADDFKITFESDFQKTGIAERIGLQNNTLKHYVTEELPKTGSLETWLFNVFLKTYLKDSNAVVITVPDFEEFIKDPSAVTTLDWSRPYPQIIESEDLIWEDESFVITKVEDYVDMNRKKWDQFLCITTEGLMLFRQVNQYTYDQPFQVFILPYQFGYLPACKVGNIIYEEEDGKLVYDSVLAPCLPSWNEVLFRTDDLNILWAMHALPQKWALKMSPCKTCNGTGIRTNRKDERVSCNDCSGSGRASSSPFGLMEINIDRVSAVNPNPLVPPVPPAGYIERPVETVKLFQEDILQKEFQGFKAIGLELLGQIPAAQSGIAKEYDRKELNTFCFSVTVHLAQVYRKVCFYIMLQRYNALFASSLMDSDKIQAALPQITVPTDYDVLTSDMVAEQLKKAVESKFNPLITSGIEMDYVEKLFGENSIQKTYLKLLSSLDPLPFKSTDEKTVLLASNGCSQLDYILSANLAGFITQKVEEDATWYDKPFNVQRAELYTMAAEKQAQIRAGIVPIMDNMSDSGASDEDSDNLGKLPLAIQQLSLAAERAGKAGNTALFKTLNDKINNLLGEIG